MEVGSRDLCREMILGKVEQLVERQKTELLKTIL